MGKEGGRMAREEVINVPCMSYELLIDRNEGQEHIKYE